MSENTVVTEKSSPIWVESFITKNFKKMPKWVRVTVYMAIVFVYLYQIISPKYIGGNIQFIDSKNNKWPYPGQAITYYIQGNSYEVRTTSKGDWALPIPGGLTPISMNVHNVDTGGYLEYTISIPDILNNTFRNKPLFLLIEDNKVINKNSMKFSKLRADVLISSIMDIFSPPPLHAQELKLHQDIINIIPKSSTRETIEKEVNDLLKNFCNMPSMDTNKKVLDLVDDLNMKQFDLLILFNQITEEFKIDIPIDHWKKLKTNEDISSYIFSRMQIIQYLSNNGIEVEYDYIKQIEALPPEMTPKF